MSSKTKALYRSDLMGEPKALVDYVIVDYRTPELARTALDSLRVSEVPYSVILVDADAAGWGYSEAVHWGVKQGDAPIVCALNADVACLDSQKPIVELFAELPDVAVVGPRQVDEYGIVRHGGIVGTNDAPRHRFWGCPIDDVDEQSREEALDCVTVSGSVYYSRRSVWEKLGGFAPFPFYYEETAFSYIVRHAGLRVVFSGLSTWRHHWGSSPVTEEWKRDRFLESQAMFRKLMDERGIEHD